MMKKVQDLKEKFTYRIKTRQKKIDIELSRILDPRNRTPFMHQRLM
jgi:hypothetical protein